MWGRSMKVEYEINYSKFVNEKHNDVWRWIKIKAKDEEEAIKKLREIRNVNYVLSCTPVKKG